MMLSQTKPALRPWWPWIATAFAFPPAGLLGHALTGGVDRPMTAAVAGALTGAVIGLGEWVALRGRGFGLEWPLATSAGLALGLTAGAAAVSYNTDRPALAVMGALSGLGVGLAQASVARVSSARLAGWAAATAGLWAAGWMVSAGVIDPADRWPVFGITGALAVAATQSVFVSRLVETHHATNAVQS